MTESWENDHFINNAKQSKHSDNKQLFGFKTINFNFCSEPLAHTHSIRYTVNFKHNFCYYNFHQFPILYNANKIAGIN